MGLEAQEPAYWVGVPGSLTQLATLLSIQESTIQRTGLPGGATMLGSSLKQLAEVKSGFSERLSRMPASLASRGSGSDPETSPLIPLPHITKDNLPASSPKRPYKPSGFLTKGPSQSLEMASLNYAANMFHSTRSAQLL